MSQPCQYFVYETVDNHVNNFVTILELNSKFKNLYGIIHVCRYEVPAGQCEDDKDVTWKYHRLWIPAGQDKDDQDVVWRMKANQNFLLFIYEKNEVSSSLNKHEWNFV